MKNPEPPAELENEDYELATTPSFERAFSRLDRPIAQQIQKKLIRLAKYPRLLAKPLRDPPPALVGLRKYRVGDYRVLFWIDHSRHVITLYTVKHRSAVYKQL